MMSNDRKVPRYDYPPNDKPWPEPYEEGNAYTPIVKDAIDAAGEEFSDTFKHEDETYEEYGKRMSKSGALEAVLTTQELAKRLADIVEEEKGERLFDDEVFTEVRDEIVEKDIDPHAWVDANGPSTQADRRAKEPIGVPHHISPSKFFWYLATPYSNYKYGMEGAFEDAAAAAGYLIKRDVKVFCPIAHCHAIAVHGHVDRTPEIWLSVDAPFMEAACGLIIVQMPGWEESCGIEQEMDTFREAKKPIYYATWTRKHGMRLSNFVMDKLRMGKPMAEEALVTALEERKSATRPYTDEELADWKKTRKRGVRKTGNAINTWLKKQINME